MKALITRELMAPFLLLAFTFNVLTNSSRSSDYEHGKIH